MHFIFILFKIFKKDFLFYFLFLQNFFYKKLFHSFFIFIIACESHVRDNLIEVAVCCVLEIF